MPPLLQGRMRLILVFLCLGCLLLSSCDGPLPGAPDTTATPASVIAPIDTPHQPYEVVQFCNDTTSSVAYANFLAANKQVADWIDQAVQPNEDGKVVYVTLINSNSFAPESTVLTIIIPPIPPDPPKPVPQATPTPTGDNIGDPQKRHAVEQANAQALQQWQQELAMNHQKLAQVRQAVKHQTDQLRNLQAPLDDVSTDIFGCVKRASLRFQDVHGNKLLLIASDLFNNTWQEWTPDYPLSGARVAVVFHYCPDAPSCDANDANWRHIFLAAGASGVALYDPNESLTLPNPLTN